MTSRQDSIVGRWAGRRASGTRWHLIESVVNDEAIPYCGRRMALRGPGGELLEVQMGVDVHPNRCRTCLRRGAGVRVRP
jgi:hypothetical protein